MRVAEARLTQATVAARRGDLEHAVDLAAKGLALDRKSSPSLAMVAAELKQELLVRYPNERSTKGYVEQLHRSNLSLQKEASR